MLYIRELANLSVNEQMKVRHDRFRHRLPNGVFHLGRDILLETDLQLYHRMELSEATRVLEASLSLATRRAMPPPPPARASRLMLDHLLIHVDDHVKFCEPSSG